MKKKNIDDISPAVLTLPETGTRSTGFDPSEFSSVLRAIKGDRSIKRMSLDFSVSPSYLSKALTGRISKPSIRTVQRLVFSGGSLPSSLRERLIQASGYTREELTRDSEAQRNAERESFSASAELGVSYSGDLVEASGRVLRALMAQNGGRSSGFAVSYYKDYFIISEKATGREYVVINMEAGEGELMKKVFYFAFLLGIVAEVEGSKPVIITTGDRRFFDTVQKINFDDMPMNALLACWNGHSFDEEVSLKGSRLLSLLDCDSTAAASPAQNPPRQQVGVAQAVRLRS